MYFLCYSFEYNFFLKFISKTTILQRFSQDFFSTEYVATIGVGKCLFCYSLDLSLSLSQDFQIRTIEVDSKRCKLQVWDTAGQDRFKCVVGAFYRNAHGVIICFDLTDVESFRNINNWYEEVKRYCPEGTQVYLVGTKSDLKARRTVSAEMIRTYTEKVDLTYLETSSKANENVEKCFIDFTRQLVEHTNQVEMAFKSAQTVDVHGDRKTISSSGSGGCYGSKCII
jgi:Ras-related protein Rab-1A